MLHYMFDQTFKLHFCSYSILTVKCFPFFLLLRLEQGLLIPHANLLVKDPGLKRSIQQIAPFLLGSTDFICGPSNSIVCVCVCVCVCVREIERERI